MANTIPRERWRPRAGDDLPLVHHPSADDVVVVHAAETDEGEIVPDPDLRPRVVVRVVGGAGDVVVAARETCTSTSRSSTRSRPNRPAGNVPNEQYFLLATTAGGIESRTFGPVLGDAIFARYPPSTGRSRHHVPPRPELRPVARHDRRRLDCARERRELRRASRDCRGGRGYTRGRRDGGGRRRSDGAGVRVAETVMSGLSRVDMRPSSTGPALRTSTGSPRPSASGSARRAPHRIRRRARRVRDRSTVVRRAGSSCGAGRARREVRTAPLAPSLRSSARAGAARSSPARDARAHPRDAGRAVCARARHGDLHPGRAHAS